MQSLAPTFGQLFGAGKFPEMGKEANQGVWLAIFLSIIGSLLLSFPQPLFSIAKASPEMTEKATLYLRILAFSLPASLNFLVYNTLNNAMARPKMVMAIQVTGLLLKIPLNTLFIFGGWGIPHSGGGMCRRHIHHCLAGIIDRLAHSPIQPVLPDTPSVRHRLCLAELEITERITKSGYPCGAELFH